uniref:Cyclin-dependent kinase inhibitor n=1 Tax=Leersia perrieri TaxID=77586 RepID=A0A0D9VPB0_9ORYZ
MGKYMRKGKVSGEVAVMEVAGALLGVRTRSRTLALQRSPQKPPEKGEGDPSAAEYLELRSRRLEKPPPHTPPAKEKEVAHARGRAVSAVRRASPVVAEEFEAAEVEVSFGDNVLDFDAMDRSTRETTPCSLIRSSEMISTPGSTTKTNNSMSSRRRMETVCRYVPSSLEMEEFFAAAEQQQHQAFRERYNFCPVTDCPLPGRYEWARLDC